MCCGGHKRRSLHGHDLGGARWKAASYCGAQTLLLRSDGAVIGHGVGMGGDDVDLRCRCDADSLGGDDGFVLEPTEEDDDEGVLREQEEEAASRGWAWRPPTVRISLGLEAPALLPTAKLCQLPEPAAMVCACPGASHVLGHSGAIYSARWHGTTASRGPCSSPWSCWTPPSPAQRLVEISALSAHVLLRTAAGGALSFGDPQEGVSA